MARYLTGYSMNCAECDAFVANYHLPLDRYAEATENLFRVAGAKEFGSPEFQIPKREALAARSECLRAKEALRVHKESRVATLQRRA